ncbi:hypothetical protein FA13DRAFT_1104768 [Coprinellus micaceus]|uniref:Uncharacterized protein n=1 Tax=Coprinellus micaceus TaxID=71717 RepID=A0A4Y7RKK7_COPMI|nr:hypothetical protein FA13DRAFT_1104768 [Coprinellus micaceus]
MGSSGTVGGTGGGSGSMDTPPDSNLGMTPSTSPSTSSITTCRSPAATSTLSSKSPSATPKPPSRTSTGWFSSLGRNRGRQASHIGIDTAGPAEEGVEALFTIFDPSSFNVAFCLDLNRGNHYDAYHFQRVSSNPETGEGSAQPTMHEAPHEHEHDHDGLPPMLTITDSFPIPMHGSPSAEEVPPQNTLRMLAEGPVGGRLRRKRKRKRFWFWEESMVVCRGWVVDIGARFVSTSRGGESNPHFYIYDDIRTPHNHYIYD